MPTVVRENVDELNALLKVHLTPEDYLPKLNSELKKYAHKAQIKGFRKGKTPESFVKKLYGNSLLVDIVNQMIQERLFQYIEDENLKLFGEPLMSEKQTTYEFNVFNPESMEFLFDIGVYPEVILSGIDKDSTFDYFVREVPGDLVDKEYINLLREMGEPSTIEKDFTEGDLLTCDLTECADDLASEQPWKAESVLNFSDLEEKLKEQIKILAVGDSFVVDRVYELEPKLEEKLFRKYVLKIEDERIISDKFQVTITEAKRMIPAAENDDFFQKAFGTNNVTNAAEGKEIIKKFLGKDTMQYSNGLFYKDIREMLMTQHEVPLPEAFIKRYLLKSNPDMTEEKVDLEFSEIVSSIKWGYLKSLLTDKLQIQISQEMVRSHFENKIYGYLQHQVAGMESLIKNWVDKMMQDEKQVKEAVDEMENYLIVNGIKETVSLKEIILPKVEFEEKTKIFNARRDQVPEKGEPVA